MTLARALVRTLARAAREPLPPEVAAVARLHFLDAAGVGLAAGSTSIGRPYRRLAAEMVDGGRASVFAHRTGTTAPYAAMINGGLIHSLEYDDTHTASIAHGSAVLAPAALAAAEYAGMSGAALLGAYARGWEMLIRIGRAAPGAFQTSGFQVTSVGGALTAAQIAAELGGLDEDRCVAAIGIALSQASGVFEFLANGATVKSLHAGWAAHGGLLGAAFARAGLTGPETAFEGRFGLFRVFARDDGASDRFAAEIESIGREWHLADAAFKFYPCCHYLHPFVEAAGQLAERGVTPEEIERLLCRVPPGAAGVICEPWQAKSAPPSGHAARWSLPITVAARLVEGRVDLDTFERGASQDVLDLVARTAWEPLPEARFPDRFEAEISCRMRDGTVHEVRIEDVYGNRSRPAGEEAVRRKFRGNARRVLSEGAANRLEAAVESLEAAADLHELTAALRAGD